MRLATVCVVVAVAGCAPTSPGRLAAERQAGVAADEPQAVEVARDVLAAGGTAADAAAALAFGLAVTYPVAAGVGGGGSCVVFDGPTAATDTLEFLPRSPAAGGGVAVPGLVRGFAALHARYGRLPWARVVEPAEGLAKAGFPMTRALGRNVAALPDGSLVERGLGRLFGKSGNGRLGDGDRLTQVELAATLGVLRTRGAGDLYLGLLARQFLLAANAAGGSVTPDDLRGYVPVWGQPTRLKTGDLVVNTTAVPPEGGAVAAHMWAMLAADNRYARAGAGERPHLLAEASLRAVADASTAAPTGTGGPSAFRADTLMRGYDPAAHATNPVTVGVDFIAPSFPGGDGATGFIVADNDGSAVACVLTMGGPFGTAAIDPVTGIVLAAPIGPGNLAAFLGPVVIVREKPDVVVFAASASGGPAAPVAISEVAAAHVLGGRTLAEAMTQPRLFHGGVPDRVVVEPAADAATLAALTSRGHRVFRAEPLGFVNALGCPGGLGRGAAGCFYGADSRGSGMAALP